MNANYNSIWQTISVEVEGPFTKTPLGNEYVVILTDLCSKWIEMKAIPNKTAASVASFVMSIFARMGFCDCKFCNMDPTFEKAVRLAIHKAGEPFVRNVVKFRAVLDRIWNEELSGRLDEQAAVAADAENNATEVQVLGTDEVFLLQGLVPREPDPPGHHTERFLHWVGINADTWDVDLDGYLFKLRMGGGGSPERVGKGVVVEDPVANDGEPGASPFDVIYAGRTGPGGARGSSKLSSWYARGRGRSRPRGRGRPFVQENYRPIGTGLPVQGPRRPRGRPRKTTPTVHYELVECRENSVEEAVALLHEGGSAFGQSEAEEASPIASRQKYGLRTTLKASVKTDIVQLMLKRSASKRSGLQMPVHPLKKARTNSSYSDASEDEDDEMPESILGLENVQGESRDNDDEAWEQSARRPLKLKRKRGRPRKLIPGVHIIHGMVKKERAIKQEVTEDDDSERQRMEGEENDEEGMDGLEDDEELDDDNDELLPKVPCPSCPGIMLPKKELAIHESFHRTGSKLLHCLYCTHITGTWEHMQDHLLQHMDNESVHGAASILKKLRGTRSAAHAVRKLRRKELVGRLPLRCSQCVNVRMATTLEQKVHQSCHREDSRLLRCPHCTHVSGTWPLMQEHLAVHPEVPSEAYDVPIEERTCGRCQRVFETGDMAQQHMMVFHGRGRKYQCDTCGKTFKERKSILRHQELHANVVYQCDECNYKTKIQRDFLDHQRIHKGQGFDCNLCEKVFSRHCQLSLHLESHRKDKGVVICDQCGHQANGMAALRHHIRNHHGIAQSWPCSLCTYIGKTKSNLKGHTDRIHNKKFKCDICEFAALEECTLVRHIDIYHNEGERRFPCPHCTYRAREPKCLTEHVRVLHNPFAAKFPCEFCNVEFKTKSMLRDHLPQHTGQRFVCQMCGYIAKYRSILYRHVKKRHPGRTLADVMQNMPPTITQTPSGKPILPPKSRAPRRSKFMGQRELMGDVVGGGLEIDIANMQESEVTLRVEGEEEDDDECGTVTYITSEMLAQATAGLTDGEGNMFIATTEDGETLSFDSNSIVLDANFLAQAAAGGAINLPNNLCLQIIQKDQNGESITMQVIPSHGVRDDGQDGEEEEEEEEGVEGEGDQENAVELLLLAGDDDGEDMAQEGEDP